MNEEPRNMPDANRLSVLLATVLLAYALTHLIEVQRSSLELSVFGILISIPMNVNIAATFLSSSLTAAGMDWLLRGHSQFDGKNTFQHWILPALTAFALGIPLYYLPFGLAWWVSFSLGGVLLLLVFLAEYVALDSSDLRYPAASAGLVALSYTLFLILMASLAFFEVRLLLVALIVFPTAGLVSLRALKLRTGKWEVAWAIGIALVLTQLAAALHYWPLTPIQSGLALLGPLYALTELAQNLNEEISVRRAGLEAVLGLTVFWVAAILLRG